MQEAIVCTGCGSKFVATRSRCPKCRTPIPRADPAAAAARSRRLAIGSGIFFLVFVVALGTLWATRRSEPAASGTVAPADPLASRRQPVPAADAAPSAIAAADARKQRAFMATSDLGTVSYGSGDFAGALAQFEAAVARNPRDAESLSNLGQVLIKLDRVAESLPHLERACALDPDRWAYRFNLARAHGLLKQWDESVASYRRAQQLFPDDYVTTFNLALTLHKRGDEPAAVEEYKKAVTLNPDEASFRMALAISHEALQQRQEAAAAYGEYLRLAPSAADAEKVKSRIAQLTGSPEAAPRAPAGL